MRKSEIKEAIINYVAGNADNLKGAMNGKNYFRIKGQTVDDLGRSEQIRHGSLVDIIAARIEENAFFGRYVPERVDRVNESSNIIVTKLHDGDDVSVSGKVNLGEGKDISITPLWEDEKRKDYLDAIRSKEGFMQAAELFGINNVSEITETLYASDNQFEK
jgi:hypothetical protein